MDEAVWTVVAISFGFGAAAGIAQLVGGRRTLSVRTYVGVVLNSGLAGVVMASTAAIAAKAKGVGPIDPLALIGIAVASGYAGAPATIKLLDLLQRVRLTNPHDGDQRNDDRYGD